MRISAWFVTIACGMFAIATVDAGERDETGEKIDFNRDVRPILSKYCFSCHGFDEKARKAGLRLDLVESATSRSESGATAIVPRSPDRSELILRVTSSTAGERMPPAETGKALTESQIETLRRWIEEGASYAKHWAFQQPVVPTVPHVQHAGWSKNSIDDFVLSRLEKEKLHPSIEADSARLLRRVSLDLIGLPPTIEELGEYLDQVRHDPEQAYLNAVDRLLASPHFGERMTIDWLDAARYADTNGYFGDKPRQAWPWRDWVIAAFNANMPFDQFTIEQLAGDLLPNATREQRVATGFHRNAMANNETGIIDEEYRVEAVADRVDTTAAVWLGLTIGCAQCHDHKFDPISQREYYQLFAYFNNSVEPGMVTADSPPPMIEVPTAAQEAERNRRQQRLTECERAFANVSISLEKDIADWQQTALVELAEMSQDPEIVCDFDAQNHSAKSIGTNIKKERGIRGEAGRFDATQHLEIATDFDVDRPWSISVWFKSDSSLGCLFSKIEPEGRRRGIEVIWMKEKLYINLVSQWGVDEITVVTAHRLPASQWLHASIQYDGSRKAAGVRLRINDQEIPLNSRVDGLSGRLKNDEPFRIARRDQGLGFYGLLDQFLAFQRLIDTKESTSLYCNERLRGILERRPEKLPNADSTFLKEYYIEKVADVAVRNAYYAKEEAGKSAADLRRMIPTTLVMEDRKESRATHVLLRGQYDQPGAEVAAGIPDVFGSVPKDASPNRLTFARWLVSREHPLTARVFVNRMWQNCFGEGLVRTPCDFGSQGELPTHPEVLDLLAVRFVESGWDIKQLLRLIVTSATYCQSSQATADQLHRDPDNRLLDRGPRFRLSAELVRDHAISVSGLLSTRVGGSSVRPYQPEGLWEEVSYNEDQSYTPDSDDGLWRRSLYTYWKRQAPPPSQLTFDAGTREKCLVRRSRTNTPLQALVMLNDPTWIEASRVLAEKSIKASGDDLKRIERMFRQVVSRSPEFHELQLLNELLIRQRQHYHTDVIAAQKILKIGMVPRDPEIPASELAAWTIVAQTILNLDEVVTRR